MIAEYMLKMASERRVIVINENGHIHTWLTFSICNDTESYENKKLFEYSPHDPTGSVCFIEKLVSRKWSLSLRKQLEEAIVHQYPSVDTAVWISPNGKVIYRRKHELRH